MPKSVLKKCKTVVIENVCIIRHIIKNDKWELDAGLKLGGDKKYRKRFKSLNDAKVHAEILKVKLQNQGISAFKLSNAELADAEQALKKLQETKFRTLLEVVEFALRYGGKNMPDITIKELADSFMSNKLEEMARNLRGASEATIKDYKFRHGILTERFGTFLVREFTETDFLPLFKEKNYSPHLLSKTKTLLNFAVKQGYIPENPIKLDAPRQKVAQPPIFSDQEWINLIKKALHNTKLDLAPYIILGLWCGLRPHAELQRLDWKDIHLDDDKPSVYIHPDWKVKHSRWVDIPKCAVNLLKRFQQGSGPVVSPKNLRRRLDYLKQDAGVTESWSPDIMRHTYASMHYGLHGDKNGIANQLGHVSQGVLDHYINNGKRMRERAKLFFDFKII